MWLEILNNVRSRKKAIKFPKTFQKSPDEVIETVSLKLFAILAAS